MKYDEIDVWCDLYECRLRRGDVVSIDQFLSQNALPHDDSLLAELQKIQAEFGSPARENVVPGTLSHTVSDTEGQDNQPIPAPLPWTVGGIFARLNRILSGRSTRQ